MVIEEIYTHGNIHELSFSVDGPYLVSNRKRIKVAYFPPNADQSHLRSSSSLFIKDHWITLDILDVLWLPSEYRATCAAAYENRLVMRHASGQVSLCEIDVGRALREGESTHQRTYGFVDVANDPQRTKELPV